MLLTLYIGTFHLKGLVQKNKTLHILLQIHETIGLKRTLIQTYSQD